MLPVFQIIRTNSAVRMLADSFTLTVTRLAWFEPIWFKALFNTSLCIDQALSGLTQA